MRCVRAPGEVPPPPRGRAAVRVRRSAEKESVACLPRTRRGTSSSRTYFPLSAPKHGAEPSSRPLSKRSSPCQVPTRTSIPSVPSQTKSRVVTPDWIDRGVWALRGFFGTGLSDRWVLARARGTRSARRVGRLVAETRRRARSFDPHRIRDRSSCSSGGSLPQCLAHRRSRRA